MIHFVSLASGSSAIAITYQTDIRLYSLMPVLDRELLRNALRNWIWTSRIFRLFL